MEKTLSTHEVMGRLRAAMFSSIKNRTSPEDYRSLYADCSFASAGIHLHALVSLAATCDSAVESCDMPPELQVFIERISETLHVIIDGLDESIADIAEIYNYRKWQSAGQFEKELKEYVKNH